MTTRRRGRRLAALEVDNHELRERLRAACERVGKLEGSLRIARHQFEDLSDRHVVLTVEACQLRGVHKQLEQRLADLQRANDAMSREAVDRAGTLAKVPQPGREPGLDVEAVTP